MSAQCKITPKTTHSFTQAKQRVSEWWFNAVSATEAIFTARSETKDM